VPLAAAVLLACGLLAACGSSSSSSSSSTTSTAAAASGGQSSASRTALRKCLAQHGVKLPNRPRTGGSGQRPPGGYGGPRAGGGFFGRGNGGPSANPKLAAALKACGAGNFLRNGARFRLSSAALQKYVTCVRSHGYNLPKPNTSGKGPVFPASIRTNKKFLAASKVCQSLLVPQRPPSTGTSTSSAAT
jgi:hypothetical protein